VGDRIVDIQAGKSVGATTLLVLTGYGRQSAEECRQANIAPDYIEPSLPQAVDRILEVVDKGGII
jgi:ribonucleotide monophosphatase NagD (HAD superfamily)